MDTDKREEIIRDTEMKIRREIAAKMYDDRMSTELIRKYTGIDLSGGPEEKPAYDIMAKQIACEMLLHGVELDAIAAATGVPYAVLKELQSQLPD